MLNCKGRWFESHPSFMPVIFFHRTWESTEYTVLTHIGVWEKTKINMVTECLNIVSACSPYNRITYNIHYLLLSLLIVFVLCLVLFPTSLGLLEKHPYLHLLISRPYAHDVILVGRPHPEVKMRLFIGQSCCAARTNLCVSIVSSPFYL